jgi:hypothetical protein
MVRFGFDDSPWATSSPVPVPNLADVSGSAPAPIEDFDPRTPIREKWALVVGVGTFKDPNVRPLTLATKDARDLTAAITNPNVGRFRRENVRTLVDSEATLQNIRTAIGWVRERADRNDRLLLFFASHGSPRELDPNGVSYILTNDTDTTDAATLYGTSLQMIDLVENISRDIRAARVVLVLDTCYSAAAERVLHTLPSRGPPQIVGRRHARGAVRLRAGTGFVDGASSEGHRIQCSARGRTRMRSCSVRSRCNSLPADME